MQAGSFALVVDEPVSAGGTGLGPMPTDLLLASLSSCYALALAWAARKRGFELPDLEVTATGTYEGPRFAAIELTVTTSLSVERLTPLLEPARRVCYVSNTLAQLPRTHGVTRAERALSQRASRASRSNRASRKQPSGASATPAPI